MGPQILKAGPLLYLAQSNPASTNQTWYNTHAILQAPYLTLSLSEAPLSSNAGPSTSPPFRQFNVRHANVESLPSTTIDALTASQLHLGVSDPSGVTAYVFEVTLPVGPALEHSLAGVAAEARKERFASTSPWEKGKWVCHMWYVVLVLGSLATSH